MLVTLGTLRVNSPNYASLFAMELEKSLVNDKITALCQTNMSPVSYETLQTTKMNFEKLLSLQVFKNHNRNPFQSFSSLSIRALVCICCVIYTFFSCFERLLWIGSLYVSGKLPIYPSPSPKSTLTLTFS